MGDGERAVRGTDVRDTRITPVTDRREAFAAWADRIGCGEVTTPPAQLRGEARRIHVRRTLLEDHTFRIRHRPDGAALKFRKLAGSPFSFFRGTALLFYRDLAGLDGHLPTVLAVGDVHPENFGVMPNRDGAPFFGVNDFDEAGFAPFSWDLRRGAVGFWMAAREHGLPKKQRRKVVRRFLRGYIAGLRGFARDDSEKWRQLRLDTSPPLIRDLIEASMTDRREHLDQYVDLDKGEFRPTRKVVPATSRKAELQAAIDQYRDRSSVPDEERAGHFQVKDVAVKRFSGTASLGLDRVWVLIDGPTDDPCDDLILELKQARRSAMDGLAPLRIGGHDGVERVVESEQIHVVGGDPYYGCTELDGRPFLVRERSPFKDEIDLEDLDFGEWKEYAEICGGVVAQAHARSDEDTGVLEGNAEEAILGSVSHAVMVDDLVRFAEETAKRHKRDWKAFRKDHALGAFADVRVAPARDTEHGG
ncbi:MAG: DUF2252 family protein [Myxococcota bacterium]